MSDVNEKTLEALSEKEFEVLLDIFKSLSNKQISLRQELTTHTIKWHTQNIYSKLGVKNRTAAARWLNE